MGYKYSFVDNETYSAADINEITKRLVTSGIEDPFTDGVPHNLKCFNLLNSNMATSGIVPESDTTLQVTVFSSDEVHIDAGTAFFESGATITIDVDMEAVDIEPFCKNYVYLEHDHALNIIRPTSSTQEPTGDVVMLAIIDENGNVEDKRQYAVGKLPKYISGYNLPKSIEFSYSEPGTYEIDVQGKNYSYFIIIGKTRNYSTSGMDVLGFWTPFDPLLYKYGIVGDGELYITMSDMPIRVCGDNALHGGRLSLSYEGNILTLTINQVKDNPIDGKLEIIAV